MSRDLDLNADYIDMRDVTERAEEIEAEIAELLELDEGELDDEALARLRELGHIDLADEATTIRDLIEDTRGNGGDHQWRGDWYPGSLIRDSYFETAMDELLEDIGDMPKNIPSYLTVTVNYEALRQDYTSTEINGETYWYR